LRARLFESISSRDPERAGPSALSRCFRQTEREVYMKAVFVRSLIRSRITSKPAIYVVGDSHTGMFHKTRPFIVHWLGPATAYKLKDPESTTRSNKRLFRVLNQIVKHRDKVLLVFGEVDCRVHIYNQFIRSNRKISMEELIDNTIENYGVVLRQIDEMGIDFYVASVPPAARERNILRVPNYPPPEVRCFINRAFNEKLSDYCEKHGYRFIDAYSKVVDKEGFIVDEFSEDGTHLKPEAIKFFEEVLGM
jgi:lysophospholipase L1-like esterase